jgi:hypothetical protein
MMAKLSLIAVWQHYTSPCRNYTCQSFTELKKPRPELPGRGSFHENTQIGLFMTENVSLFSA